MTTWRKTYRSEMRAALQDDARFSGWTEISVDAKTLDDGALPAIAVGTPREMSARDGLDSTQRDTSLVVVVKRAGTDAFALEDLCDDDAAQIEAVAVAALSDEARQWQLTETRYSTDTEGGRALGTLMMLFSVVTWPSDPLDLT